MGDNGQEFLQDAEATQASKVKKELCPYNVPQSSDNNMVDVLDSDDEEGMRHTALMHLQQMRSDEDGSYDPMNDVD